MDILILGGTQFVGRHLVEAALDAGHQVTLFNRGSRPGLYPGVVEISGDRDGRLDGLKGGRWDIVFDPSGYVPRIVRQSAELLRDSVGHYVFISSISVYADFQATHETSPLKVLADPSSEDIGTHYGEMKVVCEQLISDLYGERALIGRPGFIVGPYDGVPRLPYLLQRFSQPGERLAGSPDQPVQIINARDMADWLLNAANAGLSGAYNLTGHALPMRELLEGVAAATGQAVTITYTDDDFLQAQGIAPLDGLTYWVPTGWEAIMRVDTHKADQAGLTHRPLAQTLTETLSTLRRDGYHPDPLSALFNRSLLQPEQEAAILQAWHQRIPDSSIQ